MTNNAERCFAKRVDQAVDLLSNGKHEEAIAAANSIIEDGDVDDASSQRAWYIRANSKQLKGQVEESIPDYSTLLQLPHLPIDRKARALLARAEANKALGKNQDALVDWKTIIDCPSAYSTEHRYQALLQRAQHKLLNDQPRETIEDCEQIIEPVKEKAGIFAAQARLVQAQAYGKLEQYAELIVQCSALLSEWKDLSADLVCRAHYIRAYGYEGLNQPELGVSDYHRALDTPCATLGSIELEITIRFAGLCHGLEDSVRLSKATARLKSILGDIDDNSVAEYLFISSNVRKEQGSTLKAIASLDHIIIELTNIEGDNLVLAFGKRGLLHLESNNPLAAIDDFDQILKRSGDTGDEDYWIVLMNRGLAYSQVGEIDLAIADYTKVISDCPEQFGGPRYDAIRNRGIYLRKHGDLENALVDFGLLANMPVSSTSNYDALEYVARGLFERGRTYGLLGKTADEIQEYTKVIENRNGVPPAVIGNAYNFRGLAYMRSDQPQKAASDFTKLIDGKYDQDDDSIALCYRHRGFAYTEQGNHEKALSDFTKLAEGFPALGAVAVAHGLLYRGYLHSRIGDFSKSVEDYSHVIQLGSRAPAQILGEAYFNRAADYAMHQARLAHAINDLDCIIDRLEGVSSALTAKAYVLRGIARCKSGDKEGLGDCRYGDDLFPLARSQGGLHDIDLDKMTTKIEESMETSKRIDLLLERARRCIYYGAWQEAVEDFNTVILEEPNCSEEQLARAWELRLFWCMLSGDERGCSEARKSMVASSGRLSMHAESGSDVLDDEDGLLGGVKWL